MQSIQPQTTPAARPYLVYALTVFAILLLSSSPAVTRIGVTRTLTVYDLLFLRCAIGGMVLLPFFLFHIKSIPSKLLWLGFALAFFQGWGMHLVTIIGFKYAPSAHGSALGPGFIPVWVAMWAWLFYRIRPTRTQGVGLMLIALGAIVMLVNSQGASFDRMTLTGDFFFLMASAMGGVYLVYVQRHQVPPLIGASMVSVYSGAVFVPWYFLSSAPSKIMEAPINELLLQIAYQGIGVGVLFIIILNYVVLKLGSQRFSIIGACVPILALGFGRAIAGDGISVGECVAIALISSGVLYGAFYKSRVTAGKPADA